MNMHKIAAVLLATAAPLLMAGCGEMGASSGTESAASETVTLETDDQRISYAFGQDIADGMGDLGLDLDQDAFLAGLNDVLDGKALRLSEDEIKAAFATLGQRAQQKRIDEMDALKAENLAKGEAYLAANAQKDGVTVTESGLQYKVLQRGDGPSPSAEDRVKVHYHGTLIDGTVFDSSVDRGEPATFPLNGVIKGWTEIVQKMKVGDKFEVAIPPDMAYGENGPPAIGPNATLIFEIELMGIEG